MKVNVYVNWEAGSITAKPEEIISDWVKSREDNEQGDLSDWLCDEEDLTMADLFFMSDSDKEKLKRRWHNYCAEEAYAQFYDEYQLVELEV